jgi:hypothetical protein
MTQSTQVGNSLLKIGEEKQETKQNKITWIADSLLDVGLHPNVIEFQPGQ